MPNRILREGIITSERVNSLSWETEVFYRRLMSVVDDFARYTAHRKLLRAALYPLQLDRVTEDRIGEYIQECVSNGLIVTYSVAGKDYLYLNDFRQQARAKESKYPSPDGTMPSECIADATQVSGACQATEKLMRSETETETETEALSGARACAKAVSAPKPELVSSNPRFGTWAADEGFVQVVDIWRDLGYPLIDEDIGEAFQFAWKRLDFEQRLECVDRARKNRALNVYESPQYMPSLRKFVEREYKRDKQPRIRDSDRKPAVQEVPYEKYVYVPEAGNGS